MPNTFEIQRYNGKKYKVQMPGDDATEEDANAYLDNKYGAKPVEEMSAMERIQMLTGSAAKFGNPNSIRNILMDAGTDALCRARTASRIIIYAPDLIAAKLFGLMGQNTKRWEPWDRIVKSSTRKMSWN